MQPSTKYNVGDIVYHSGLGMYSLIADIFINKWDKQNVCYRFIDLTYPEVPDFLNGQDWDFAENIDKSNQITKVA